MDPIRIQVESACTTERQIEISPENKTQTEVSPKTEGSSSFSGIFSSFHPGLGALRLLAISLADWVNVSANPNSLYFGDVNLYSSKTRYFNINNNGDCKARVSLTSPYGFSVNPGSTTIAAGSSQSVNVTFSPSAEQTYSGYVSGNHGISVYVQGTGVDPYK